MAELTRYRATINLVGAKAGAEVMADPTKPGIIELIEGGYLVPVEIQTGARANSVTVDEAHLVEDAAVASQEAPGADEAPAPAADTPEP